MFVIRKAENNYYNLNTPIGPCFGATKENARKFDSRIDASNIMGHFAFADCEIEEVEVRDIGE